MLHVLVLLAQAALPPPGLHYFGRTDYKGPGLVCGSAFAIRLATGETAVLAKRLPVTAEYTVVTRDGRFSISESQYEMPGGRIMARTADGVLKRQRAHRNYVWVYADKAPGATKVFGPAVNNSRPTAALKRITFGAIRNETVAGEKCLEGTGSDPHVS